MKRNMPVPQAVVYVLLALTFLVLTMLSNMALKHLRLDLTENSIYTLSDNTLKIIEGIDQPINLYLFFSETVSRDYSPLRKYHTQVRELLEEYVFHSEGDIQLHLVDPEPFSEDEDRATGFGLQKVPVQNSGESLYFGLAGTNAVGDIEVIPFLQSSREVFLEYDIDKLLYSLLNPKKPVLGLMTGLPMYPTGLGSPIGNPGRPWVVIEQLEQLFTVKLVFTDTDRVDDDVDLLMVAHPQHLEDQTLYAIDQYVMGGGKAIFFVDPYAEVQEIPVPGDTPLPDANIRSSSLNRLFNSWGFGVSEGTVVADFDHALQAAAPGQAPRRHIVLLGYKQANLNQEDAITAMLGQINFASASNIEVMDIEKIRMTPLVQSGFNSMLMPLQRLRFVADQASLERGFVPSGREYTIAAKIEGELTSAFDGPPPPPKEEEADGEDGAESGEDKKEEKPEAQPQYPHIAQSTGAANLLVVADVDVLSDRMWVTVREFFGRRIQQPHANNRDFIVNAVDQYTGGSELIGIRGRASLSRPFTRVIELERESSLKYRETEENLQRKLRETEQKLSELQSQRADVKSTILTAEQQQELAGFRAQMLQTRKELREVKHRLARDIDALGARLTAINIGLVPALVTLLALLFAFIRHRRRLRHE
ncbi:MAG: Gldg family protein [Gammaproteobacteria bacterium]|nr:Gldg family protein [Gammaproteobacteria bacterium]